MSKHTTSVSNFTIVFVAEQAGFCSLARWVWHDLVRNPEDMFSCSIIWASTHQKTCLWGNVNNKDTDQPAHRCSLISTFVIF